MYCYVAVDMKAVQRRLLIQWMDSFGRIHTNMRHWISMQSVSKSILVLRTQLAILPFERVTDRCVMGVGESSWGLHGAVPLMRAVGRVINEMHRPVEVYKEASRALLNLMVRIHLSLTHCCRRLAQHTSTRMSFCWMR